MDHTGLRHTRQPALGRPKCMAALVAACVPAITAAEAVRCVGILFTNCFELSLGARRARVLYLLVSLVNHACLPYLQHTNLIQEVGEGDIVAMQRAASRSILPGHQLTIIYNTYMQGHLQRRRSAGAGVQDVEIRLSSERTVAYLFSLRPLPHLGSRSAATPRSSSKARWRSSGRRSRT